MKRLVLVGGGHAHLEVLHAFRERPVPGVALLLLSPSPRAAYTGMVPGMLMGEHSASSLQFDLPSLAQAAGGRFREGAVTAIDAHAKRVWIGDESVEFTCCSINVGSAPGGASVPGMRAHATALRPLDHALQLGATFDALRSNAPSTPPAVVVVGGGAAGVEVAIALALRGARRVAVTLVHRGVALLDAPDTRAAARALHACNREGVTVCLNRQVVRVEDTGVVLDDGSRLQSSLTVWLTGAAPPAVLREGVLPRSARGFLLLDDTLRAADGSPVWGAGDCAELEAYPWVPRAGVHAVREGPVLAHNLRVALTGRGTPQRYHPQGQFLSLLLSGHDRALLNWYGITLEGRWPRRLKRTIDRAFMRRHTITP